MQGKQNERVREKNLYLPVKKKLYEKRNSDSVNRVCAQYYQHRATPSEVVMRGGILDIVNHT